MSDTKNLAIRLSLKDGEVVKKALAALGEEGQRALQRIEKAGEPASRSLLALNDASQNVRGGMEGLTGRLGPIGSAMSAMGTGGLAAAAGVAAVGLALAAAVQRSKQAAETFAEITKEADRIGVSVTAFQEIGYAAKQSGVNVEQLGEAMKELAGRAADAVASGTGDAAEGFAMIGLSTDALKPKLADTDALFTDVIERIGRLKTAGERVLAVQQIFGDEGGEPLLALIAKGADEFARMRKEAHDLGIVVDEHIVRTGANAAKQLDVLGSVIDTHLNRAVVDLAPVLVQMAQLFADIAAAVADVVDGFRELENRSTRGLRSRLAELEGQRGALVAEHEKAQTAPPRTFYSTDPIEAMQREDWDEARTNALPPSIQAIDAEIARIKGILTERDKPAPTAPRLAPYKPVELKKPGSGSSSAEEEPDRVGEYLSQLRQQVQLQGLEEEQRKRLEAVIRAQNLAMQDGKLITEEQRAEIFKLTDAIVEHDRATKAAETAQRDMQDATRELGMTFSSAFEDAIISGKNFSDVLQGLAQDIERLLLRKMVTEPLVNAIAGGFGGGGFGGGIGTLFAELIGSIFHDGGIVGESAAPGRPVPVSLFEGAPRFHSGGFPGLRPDEVPAILQRGEGVFTREQMAALGASASASSAKAPDVTVNVINQTGQPVNAERGNLRFDGERYVLDVVMRAASQPGQFREAMKGALR
ncbi:phage tail tape measure protein [Roseomonas genomospecies 6]|uniref:Bacteriophage tail tape measure C-terminal domain-containing protein n=1 Tax=Roseomonas genomospecies 6 TaxID=214106 RepID=A0A9W7NG48_9PROT|nr:phage tail tape measure protein [Roseomonas genomospecies 6]KAA0677786.1 hypothetical protein DS843_21950 [Roseomonas genomospecies 6]